MTMTNMTNNTCTDDTLPTITNNGHDFPMNRQLLTDFGQQSHTRQPQLTIDN